MKLRIAVISLSLFVMGLVACQPEEVAIPTRAVIGTSDPSDAPSDVVDTVATDVAQVQPSPTLTETVITETAIIEPTATLTETALPTDTPEPSATPSFTFTPTLEATDTPPPTATDTATATKTLIPTQTFTATPTESPYDGLTALVTAQNLNVRNGPADDYDIIAHVEEGAALSIAGVDDGANWFLVEYEGDLTGWIYSEFVSVEGGDIAEAPLVEPTALPDLVRLENVTWIQQQFNNCAPTAVTMALTYYGGQADQNIARAYLRPSHTRDVSVDIAQMTDYVNFEQPGLRSVWRMGGNWTTIRQLVASGYPVIIETSVEVHDPEPGWAGHNRLIIGYDGDVILTYDSFLGHGNYQGYRIPEDELDELWRHMNRNYMVFYPIEDEAEVAYIMGEAWDEQASIDRAHRIALAEMAADPESVFSQFNLGTTFTALGRYEEGAAAFDAAFAASQTGPEQIPFRIFWYQFSIFEAYYNVGRYNEVVDNARRALLNMGGNGAEELYYWLGMGYAGRGQFDRAITQFENALSFNPNFTIAQDEIDAIQAGTFAAPV